MTEIEERRKNFIRELAVFLAGNQAEMSVRLQLGEEYAHAWARLRNAAPLFGYVTVDEAEWRLAQFLSPFGHDAWYPICFKGPTDRRCQYCPIAKDCKERREESKEESE